MSGLRNWWSSVAKTLGGSASASSFAPYRSSRARASGSDSPCALVRSSASTVPRSSACQGGAAAKGSGCSIVLVWGRIMHQQLQYVVPCHDPDRYVATDHGHAGEALPHH